MCKRKTIFPIIVLALLIQPLPLLSAPSPDFDGDGTVGFPDFLAFVEHFGTSRGDGKYEAKYDLDGNGTVEFSDFLAFVNDFGKDVPPSDGDSTPVVIPDAILRAVIADSLGKASGEAITAAEMATLTRLDAPNKYIHDLTGLEFATNLTRLDLGTERVNREDVNSNLISDFSILSSLTSLEQLDLGGNYLSDISPLISFLSSLTSLTTLDLSDNSISDISPLSSLTSLERLYLSDNSISDISSLSSLTSLERLTLSLNSISDISSLPSLTNLTWLNLADNSISDISSLSSLTNLRYLWLVRNSISDVSVLSGLTNLRSLYIYNCSISDLAPLVANTGLGSGDRVDVRNNPLSATSINAHIPALQSRGVEVRFSASKPAVQKNEDLRDILGEAMKSFGDEEWKAEEYIYNRGNVDRLERR